MKKSIVLHPFFKCAGGISIVALAIAVIALLLFSPPANAEFETQLRFVSPSKCAECHPEHNPGKCNLVERHINKQNANCATCHDPCVDVAPEPNFNHFEAVCINCHKHTPEAIHKKHLKEHDEGDDDDEDSDDEHHGKKEKKEDNDEGLDCTACHSGNKVLIAYDSKRGSTKIYAEQLGQDLLNKGHYQVDIGRVLNLLDTDITGYDGIVFGGPTYTGIPLQGLKRFLDAQRSDLAGKQVAYLYNSISGGFTGNSYPWVFWYFADLPLTIQYPDIFPLQSYRCSTYPICMSVPYWVGLMPGRYVPRNTFPGDYLPMELTGFGGEGKNYLRPDAATEWAQTLMDCNFFSATPSEPPAVTAIASASSVEQGEPIQFMANVANPVGNLTYLWDFGDGNTSTLASPIHTYGCNGTFTVKLKVLDDALGCPGQDITIVTVTKPAGDPITYECDVQPVLTQFCSSCHGVASQGGLDVRSCASLALGGNSGPAVVPGDRWASSLYTRIIDNTMPPGGEPPPSAAQTETIGQWIDSLDPNCTPSNICSCPILP